jgi:hypothetical protein
VCEPRAFTRHVNVALCGAKKKLKKIIALMDEKKKSEKKKPIHSNCLFIQMLSETQWFHTDCDRILFCAV